MDLDRYCNEVDKYFVLSALASVLLVTSACYHQDYPDGLEKLLSGGSNIEGAIEGGYKCSGVYYKNDVPVDGVYLINILYPKYKDLPWECDYILFKKIDTGLELDILKGGVVLNRLYLDKNVNYVVEDAWIKLKEDVTLNAGWPGILYIADNISITLNERKDMILKSETFGIGTIIIPVAGSTSKWFRFKKYKNRNIIFANLSGLQQTSNTDPVRDEEAPAYALAKTLHGHQETVAFSPDGSLLASAGDDGRVFLWETNGWQSVHAMQGHKGNIRAVLFTPDGKLLASGGEDGQVIFWDPFTGKEAGRIVTKYDVQGIAFSPDGKLMATRTDSPMVLLWDLSTGKTVKSIKVLRNDVSSFAFSPDGKIIALGSEDTNVNLYDLAEDDTIPLYTLPDEFVSFAYSPDGKFFAAGGSKGGIALWDLSVGTVADQMKGPKEEETRVLFLEGGAILASVDESGEGECGVRFWNVREKTLLGMIKTDCNIRAFAASGNGKFLAVAGDNITILARQWGGTLE